MGPNTSRGADSVDSEVILTVKCPKCGSDNLRVAELPDALTAADDPRAGIHWRFDAHCRCRTEPIGLLELLHHRGVVTVRFQPREEDPAPDPSRKPF